MKISNNSLVVLLTVAIIASISGTFVSVNFIDDFITGAATTTGNVTITVSSTASCTATDAIVAFGNLGENETNSSNAANLDWIVLENNGNVNLNVTGYGSVELFATAAAAVPSTYWMIQCNGTEGGNCNTTWSNVEAVGAPGLLVTEWTYSNTVDEVNISVNVTVPDDESAGAKNGEITFTCTGA